MPHLINREEAIESIRAVLPEGECLVCFLLNSAHPYILYRGEHTTVLLSQYPRNWGQTMVLLNKHKTSISEIAADEWAELMAQIKFAATLIEAKLKPLRCYISSLGARQNLPNTCAHIHFNLLPVYREEDTPEKLFTWQHGLYAGKEAEWKDLFTIFQKAYAGT